MFTSVPWFYPNLNDLHRLHQGLEVLLQDLPYTTWRSCMRAEKNKQGKKKHYPTTQFSANGLFSGTLYQYYEAFSMFLHSTHQHLLFLNHYFPLMIQITDKCLVSTQHFRCAKEILGQARLHHNTRPPWATNCLCFYCECDPARTIFWGGSLPSVRLLCDDLKFNTYLCLYWTLLHENTQKMHSNRQLFSSRHTHSLSVATEAWKQKEEN